jgi:hypothetical protein
MVQYIEHIFQQFVNVKFVTVVRCVGKKWLFWFCEGSACVSSKTKCAICAWANFVCVFVVCCPVKRLAPNVCASAVARFRSRVLSPTPNVERR